MLNDWNAGGVSDDPFGSGSTALRKATIHH